MTRPGEQARTLGYGTCTGKTYETSQSSSSNEQEPLAMILSGEDIPPLVISILGIQLNQRRDELTHLVPEIYRVEEMALERKICRRNCLSSYRERIIRRQKSFLKDFTEKRTPICIAGFAKSLEWWIVLRNEERKRRTYSFF